MKEVRRTTTKLKWHRFFFAVLIIGNILDTIGTLYIVRNGYGYEANPIMDYFLNLGDWYFIGIKMLLGNFFGYVLYHLRALKGLIFISLIYTALVLWFTYGYFFIIP